MFIKVYPRLFRELKPVSIPTRLSYFKILNAKNINKDPRASLCHVKKLIEKGFIAGELPTLLPKKNDGFIAVPFEFFTDGTVLSFLIKELTNQGFSMNQIATELSVNRHTVSYNYTVEKEAEICTLPEQKLTTFCTLPAHFSNIRIYRERKEKKRKENQSINNIDLYVRTGVLEKEISELTKTISELQKTIIEQNQRTNEFLEKLNLSDFKQGKQSINIIARDNTLKSNLPPLNEQKNVLPCENFGKVSNLCGNTKNEIKTAMQGLNQNQKTIVLGTLAEMMEVSDVKNPIGYAKKLVGDAKNEALESTTYERWLKRLTDNEIRVKKEIESKNQKEMFERKEAMEHAEQKRQFEEALATSGKSIDDFLHEVRCKTGAIYEPVAVIRKTKKRFTNAERMNFLNKVVDN